MEEGGSQPLRSSHDDVDIQRRRPLSAHLNIAGSRGVEATFQRAFPFCVRRGRRGKVEEFTKQCLLCAANFRVLSENLILYVWLQPA